jgi:hypothetical protein
VNAGGPAGPSTGSAALAAEPAARAAGTSGTMTVPRPVLLEPAVDAGTYAPPPTAPPLPTPVAAEAVSLDPQRGITTWVEAARPSRRAAWIAAVLVGLGIGVVGVIALRGNRAPAAETTAAPPPTTTPPPAPAPPQAPTPTPPTPPSSARVPTRHPSPPPTVVLRPPKAPSVPTPPGPAPTPAPPAPPADDPGTGVLAELYAAVGGSLRRLDAAQGKHATADLWPRYLHIHIGDALGTREKRIEAHQTLRFIEREIARRSR